MIDRTIKESVIKAMNNKPVVLITGARQVGKSTLCGEIKKEFGYEYVSLDNLRERETAIKDPELFLSLHKSPLIIDEVQYAPKLLDVIESIVNKVKFEGGSNKGMYILTASQIYSLMENVSESLAGRVSIVEVSPLSLREIKGLGESPFVIDLSINQERSAENKVDINELFKQIVKGFYPELYDNPNLETETFYSDYVRTYIERDVYKITKVRDYQTFYRFLVSVAARTGQILDYTNIANDIGVSTDTVKLWIGILVKTDIVYLLQPYYNSHLNRAIKSPKVYFRDTGLACFLTSWLTPDTLKNGAIAGHMFETFVVNEIIKSFINVGKDYSKYVYYYHGKDKVKRKKVDANGNVTEESEESEIDIIIEENGVLYPVEIKKGSNPTASDADAFTVLDKDIDKKRGMGAIICTGEYKLKLRENLYSLPVEYI